MVWRLACFGAALTCLWLGLKSGDKTYLRRYKSHFERPEIQVYLVKNFNQFPCSWIRIRIPNMGQYGYRRAKSMRIRIHNTALGFEFNVAQRPNQWGSGFTTLLLDLNLTRRSSPYYSWRELWVWWGGEGARAPRTPGSAAPSSHGARCPPPGGP